jgi:hypothetical protein
MTRCLLLCALFGAVAGVEHCEADDGKQSCTDQAVLIQRKSDVQKVKPAEALMQRSNVDMEMAVAAQRESLKLAKVFAEQAANAQKSTATKKLFKSFRICGQCQNYKRFGEAHDGGYLMCMDGLNDGVQAAYSLGVEQHDQWSEDVLAQLKVNVNQFDCTVSGSNCPGCNFYTKCIVSTDGKHNLPGHESEGWTLSQALTETGQGEAQDGSLLMKMDIESSEWAIYAQEKPEVLKKFGELIVEFHSLKDEAKHEEYLQAMQHILASGLKVVHLHGNNYGGGLIEKDDASIPNVVEVTFVHGDKGQAAVWKIRNTVSWMR